MSIRLICQEFPLKARGETCTATASKSGDLDLIYDPVRICHFKNLCQARIPLVFNVVIYKERIYFLIPAQNCANLILEKRDVFLSFDLFPRIRVYEELICQDLISGYTLDDSRHGLHSHLWIKGSTWLHKYRRFHLAESLATSNT